MDKFGYPTNIKQIGDVDDSLRIYIEDYVYTYLMQYAEANSEEETIAVLVGRCMIMDGQNVLFINGAIQGKYAQSENGIVVFTKKCHEYIDNQIDKYFKGLEVVGWLQSQPNYGNFLSASYASYHINNFKKPYQVMLVTDPIEKINSFFIWNKDKTDIIEAKGFFIFYDKNKNMHNYILDNKIVKFNKSNPIEVIEKPLENFDEEYDDTPIISKDINDKETKAKKPEKQKIKLLNDFKNTNEKKFNIKNIAVPAASFLLVATVFLGGSLVSSNSRIDKLEGDVTNIRTAYNELVTYINESGTQAVFANANTSTIPSDVIETNIIVEAVEETKPSEPPKPIDTSEVAETPAPSPTPTKTPTESTNVSEKQVNRTYTVQQGDNLLSITRQIYGYNNDDMLELIMKENGITDPNTIYFGMVLDLPEEN